MVETPSRPASSLGKRTEEDDPSSACRRYPNNRASVEAVRGFVRNMLAGCPAAYVSDVVTVASELATNAVRHSSGPYVVLLRGHAGGLWSVNVEDRGPRSGLPVFPDVSAELAEAGVLDLDSLATSGRGLGIVAALCPQRWAHSVPGVDSWHVGGVVAWTGGDLTGPL